MTLLYDMSPELKDAYYYTIRTDAASAQHFQSAESIGRAINKSKRSSPSKKDISPPKGPTYSTTSVTYLKKTDHMYSTLDPAEWRHIDFGRRRGQ